MELIEGVHGSSHGFDNPMSRMVLVTIEETLEAFGIILFVFSLLRYVAERRPSAGVRIARAGEVGLPAPTGTSEEG